MRKRKGGLIRQVIHMNFSITGQEKCDLLIQVTVTAWAGLTVHAPVINLTYIQSYFCLSFIGVGSLT